MEHTYKRHGVVKGLREDYDDKNLVGVEFEEPAPPAKKRSPKSPGMVSMPRSHTVPMPREKAKHFAVGDAVEYEATLRHFGKHGAKEDA